MIEFLVNQKKCLGQNVEVPLDKKWKSWRVSLFKNICTISARRFYLQEASRRNFAQSKQTLPNYDRYFFWQQTV